MTQERTEGEKKQVVQPVTEAPQHEAEFALGDAQMLAGWGFAGAGDAGDGPPEARAAQVVQRTQDLATRQRTVLALQRTHGNAFTLRTLGKMGVARAHTPVVARTLAVARAPAVARTPAVARMSVQRHAPGAALLGGLQAGGDPTPYQPSQEQSSDGSSGGGNITDAQAQITAAQDIIKKSYGSVVKNVKTGTINLVKSRAELYAQYDRNKIDRRAKTPDGLNWKAGDKARLISEGKGEKDANGFVDDDQVVWVDTSHMSPTTIVHEMLHINSPGFRDEVGHSLNEGATEWLAQRAAAAAGVKTAGGSYASERRMVDALVAAVGDSVIINAYFGNIGILETAIDAVYGADRFAAIKKCTKAGYVDQALGLMGNPSMEQKVKAVKSLLEWVVSDDDVTIIISIFKTSSEDEKKAIAKAVQPEITSLSSHGQRARLRLALGVI